MNMVCDFLRQCLTARGLGQIGEELGLAKGVDRTGTT